MTQLFKALAALTEGSSLGPRAYDGAYNCLQLLDSKDTHYTDRYMQMNRNKN